LFAAVVCGELVALPLSAQGNGGSEHCVFDTTEASDSVSVVYSLMQEIVSSHDSVDQMTYSYYSQTIGQYFSPPKHLTLAWLPTGLSVGPPQSQTMNDYGLGGGLQFKVDKHGHVKRPILASTSAIELNEALGGALIKADSAGELLPPPKTPEFEGGVVRLWIHASLERPPMAVPLLRAKLPVIRVDSAPRLISAPNPRYPREAQYAGVSSRVVLRFVVSQTGTVVPSSFELVEAEYREFVESARVALLKAKFVPAIAAGCPVPMIVQQAVSFNILQ
jgi:TonB family protein